jgi:hypothetical protein
MTAPFARRSNLQVSNSLMRTAADQASASARGAGNKPKSMLRPRSSPFVRYLIQYAAAATESQALAGDPGPAKLATSTTARLNPSLAIDAIVSGEMRGA